MGTVAYDHHASQTNHIGFHWAKKPVDQSAIGTKTKTCQTTNGMHGWPAFAGTSVLKEESFCRHIYKKKTATTTYTVIL